jgi:hypothetical protein
MKREVISFTLKSVKPRDMVAQAMLDRDGPYRAKRVAKAKAYKRNDKHRNRSYEA